jgi:hypothetical protein
MIEQNEPKKRGFGSNPQALQKALAKSAATRKAKSVNSLVEEDVEKTGLQVGTVEGFIPTKAMLKVLQAALSLDAQHDSIKGWFELAGVNRANWYAWNHTPGFKDWWKKSFDEGIKLYTSEWLVTGLKRMRREDKLGFMYWEQVGKKILGYVDKVKIENTQSPEEEAVTKELLELMQTINSHVPKVKTVQSEVINISEEEIKQMNESK